MKTTVEFLDALSARFGGLSDYAISKKLEITRQSVSNYRSGKSHLDENTAIKVAKLLEIDAGYVIACAHSERSKTDETRAAWESIIERLGGLAAALAIGFGLSGAPAPSQAAQVAAPGPICIM